MLTLKKGKGSGSAYWLVAIAVLVLAVIAWQFYKYKLVHKNVNKAVSEKTEGLYNIHYEGLSIDEVSGILHVKNIEIIPDTAVYGQLVREKKNPPMLIKLFIPALDILGVKTPKALLTKQIQGHKVEVSNPTIEIMLDHFAKDSTVYNPSRDVYKELLGKFLKIQMDSVEILHAKVIVRNRGSEAIAFSGNNVSFLLSDLLIDSVTNKDSSRILFSRNLDMDCDEIALPSGNKKYRLRVEKLRFTGRDNSFYIGSVRLIPQLPEAEFARSFPVQKDRYDFAMEGISLRNIDRGGIWRKRIEADSLIIGKSSFKVYRDLSQPRDTISIVGNYPHQLLMRLPIPVHIRKLIFLHSFIEYKEKNGKSDSAGKVQFFDAGATIDNVTNVKGAIARNNKCILSFTAKFLNKTPVNAKIVMLLKDPHGRFSIEGNIGSIDAVSLNALTQPMGLARMEKGNIDKLQFNFKATDSSSTGKLTILYSDLKVSLLKKDKEENKYDKKGLASLAVNIIMKKSNPVKGGDARVVDVHFNRILNKSFFNLIWKTIFAGIKETAGLK
ncbi:MAG TPA: hypothetical protein VK563_12225 [Puia sp.]|nr:hypothetical protein [Puia sp.]